MLVVLAPWPEPDQRLCYCAQKLPIEFEGASAGARPDCETTGSTGVAMGTEPTAYDATGAAHGDMGLYGLRDQQLAFTYAGRAGPRAAGYGDESATC